ncbi:FtsK/SpoIIIE domain-containing protein [Actinomadura opuntiae]|uniref:FtsK/SpoIIIE domain-containing protein n=1 Tax=Actinomadura sp. OS1-43 TaxID=604315 RepID=UPI00255A9E40|nr:FtsK/SpoIIIE domain-containing protein [Actinomadura sp. OS1-43]MDL4812783.1 FtsK/SpoIIIE domain-containing protein [Actinomadura sp. OS1-43]
MAMTDWRWRHGPVSGPLHGAVALTTAWQVGTLPGIDLSPEWVLGGGLSAMGVITWHAAHDRRSWLGLGYRLATLGGGSLWLAEAVTNGWSATLGWTLAAGAVTAGLVARPIRALDEARAARQAAVAEAARAAAADEAEQDRLHGLAGEWVHRIAQVCGVKNVQVVGIEDWVWPGPDGEMRVTGYSLEVVLPVTGETWQSLGMYADNLAASARLPEGCGVEVRPGRTRGRAILDVGTYDALRDDVLLPLPEGPRSINDLVPLGVIRRGSPAAVPLRYESMLLVGSTGSGKSNELQTIIAGLLSCSDTLVCVIDYNGGSVALPWLELWANGEIRKSPILWVADNPEEAHRMCDWLTAAIEHRKRAYYAENTARGDDKVAASPRTPQIFLVTDEFGALDRDVKAKVVDINDRGRGAAIRTVTCALRATSEYAPTELLAQAHVRAAMRVTDVKELGYLYGQQRGLAAEDAPFTGYGHVRAGQAPPQIFKGYRTGPNRIKEVARLQDAWRPDLDAVTETMSPEWQRVFAERWDRSRHLVQAAAGQVAVPPPSTGGPGGAAGPAWPAPPPLRPSRESAAEGLAGALEGLDAAAARARAAREGGDGGQRRDPEADKRAFEEILSYEVVVPELVVRVLAAFGTAERMHTRDIAARIGCRPEVLGQLLSKLDVRPLPNAFPLKGKPKAARGYERAPIEAAAERINAGDLVPPEDVQRWRPQAPPKGD